MPDIGQAIAKLKSLHAGDEGVVETLICGKAAVPALREVLFGRETSGIFEPRCRAAMVLGKLGAHDALIDFLERDRAIADPVERQGDDAVTDAAASALAGVRDERAFQALMKRAGKASLTEVIDALGRFDRIEAVPFLLNALEDDRSRPVAEDALRRQGIAARSLLVESALLQRPSPQGETAGSAHRRATALELLNGTGITRSIWERLRRLMADEDPTVSFMACKLCLAYADKREWPAATARLKELLTRVNWMLKEDIRKSLDENSGDRAIRA